MPAPATIDAFLDLVRRSELIPLQRLETFVQEVKRTSPGATPKELGAQLVAEGLATQFQVEQFLQGKWRGFTIGKYKVLERLGTGGMGSVYLCEHMMVGRRVAVKVLPTAQADNPSALGRFYREARAAGVLDHPNLVTAHDIDQDGALHFLVMDYVDGSNLQDIVARSGPLSIERAAHYISQTACGLQHAHQAGLIHRDVKPANILVERNGNVRLLDLGLARFFEDTDLLTLKYDEQNVLGTADYVSPEQTLNSHEVDIRADIYSLGGTFYFVLTGRPPFAGGKVAQKLIWHQVRPPTPVTELRPDVPPGLASIVQRMMAKDPRHRYQTPAEVMEALKPWTAVPVPPPSEHEMPQLSPAITAGMMPSSSVGPGHSMRNTVRAAPVRSPRATPTTAMPAGAVDRTVRTVPPALPRTPPPGRVPPPAPTRGPTPDLTATPRPRASQTPTETDQPRPAQSAPPVQPTKLLASKPAPPVQPPRPPAPPRQGVGSGLLFWLLVLLGGVTLGVTLGWLSRL
jgi:serine/threonine protein kinase